MVVLLMYDCRVFAEDDGYHCDRYSVHVKNGAQAGIGSIGSQYLQLLDSKGTSDQVQSEPDQSGQPAWAVC